MNAVDDDFRSALRAAGLDYAGPVHADGKLYRFKAEGDKARNSWFVFHAGPPAAGAFGCWKRGLSETWCAGNGNLSQAQWSEVRRRWQEAEKERDRTAAEARDQARKTAAWILGRAKFLTDKTTFTCDSCEEDFDDDSEAEPLYECSDCGSRFTRSNSADGGSHRCPDCNKFGAKISDAGCPSCGDGELHPALHHYLVSKGVSPQGDVREYRGALVLPLRDANSELHSLQFIGADGTKRFLTGGRISGCFFTVADKPDGPLVIVEGYATGASVHEATGLATVAAMNAGNLLAVSKALREKFPEREIIIAADNDQFTDGNPGLSKATEAAIAIGARLAVPVFADVTTKPTDFNDLHQVEGLNIVKEQIESATTPKESDDEIIARLAKLPLLEYERCRDTEAGRLGIKRVSILDKLVDAKRPKSETPDGEMQGRTMDLADIESWPESVNGADVLNEVAGTFARYVALPDGAADALTLWTAHAHTFKSFICSPRLNVTSPEKGCGKTTLRDVVALLVPRPLPTENLGVAVLFRVIEANKPTMLADECDSYLRDNEELRGMLNAGHRRGGQALRCVGDDHEVRAFNVFAPAVLCGIGSLPGTLHDRSIVIRLERAKPGELRERFDSRRVDREQELCRKLARFCADNAARLEACDPALPSSAFNRLADNWRPLFAIAELAGGDWPKRAADAFTKLTSRDDTDAQGIGVMLLGDVWQTVRDSGDVRMFSKSLVESLLKMSDHPWPEAHKGRPITETWLARRLRTFGVSPKLIRVGDTVGRGYEVADFQDALDRYLPTPGDSKCYSVTTPANKGENEHSEVLQAANGVTLEKSQNANVHAGCNGVTLAKSPAKELVEADLL